MAVLLPGEIASNELITPEGDRIGLEERISRIISFYNYVLD
jgi:hypothetical protein